MILASKDGEVLAETIAALPGALTPLDAPDLCSLARYYQAKTPQTFKKVTFFFILNYRLFWYSCLNVVLKNKIYN